MSNEHAERIEYHPDPDINAAVAAEAAENELADLALGYPPRVWTCGCGASHSRGFFPVGSTSHRCMACGYAGAGGVLTLEDGGP